MEKNYALGIIDAQRGFMPAEEGERLNVTGFGELPIQDGDTIVADVNRLLEEAVANNIATFTTQDWHPQGTAHFAVEPNFNTTWPPHCIGNTTGAELHPDITVPDQTDVFYKGAELLDRGEDDTSYSGYNAQRFIDDQQLPDWLNERAITNVILGGLALDYCVKATALDLRQKVNLEVVVAIDATKPVAQDTGLAAIKEMEKAGVTFATTDEITRMLNQ
jgi:nicotinamidase/pyrazinamidase